MKTDNHYLNHVDNSDISSAEWSAAMRVLQSKKVALFIVAYNAQYFIQSVVERIPEQLISLFS